MTTRYTPLAALLVALLAFAPTSAQAQCAEIDDGICASSIKVTNDGRTTTSLATGDFLGSFAIATTGSLPVGIVNTEDGSPFPYAVTDIGDDTVTRMDPFGGLGASWPTTMSGNPIGIGYDGTHFYVTDTTDDDVDKYMTDGTYVSSFDVSAFTTFPEGIAYNPITGNLYIVDGSGGNEVEVFDTSGTWLASFPILGTSPDGIAYLPADDMYIIYDSGTDMVRYYDSAFTETFSYPGTAANGFSVGEGVLGDPALNEVTVVATGSDAGVVFEGGLSAGGPAISITVNTFDNDPERGEGVFHRGPLTNTGASTFIYVYTRTDVPGVGTFQKNLGGLFLGGATINYRDIPGGKKKNFVYLPLDAPGGTYTVTVYAADSKNHGANTIYDSDSFSFDLPPLLTAAMPTNTTSSLEIAEPMAVPNPFSGATEIRYSLAEADDVSLLVYDVTGREVASLVSGTQSAGTHAAVFSGGDLPGGVYVWRLVVGGDVTTGRVTLTR